VAVFGSLEEASSYAQFQKSGPCICYVPVPGDPKHYYEMVFSGLDSEDGRQDIILYSKCK
jgi:hypothetical protein